MAAADAAGLPDDAGYRKIRDLSDAITRAAARAAAKARQARAEAADE